MTLMASCKHCSLARTELRQAIYRANRDVMRLGQADTTAIARLKAEAAACKHCAGTGQVPGRPLTPGRRPAAPKPAPPVVVKPQLDLAEIAAALEAAAVKVSSLRHSVNEKPQVTGYCHDCEKQIVWGRIYCGGCSATRANRGKRTA